MCAHFRMDRIVIWLLVRTDKVVDRLSFFLCVCVYLFIFLNIYTKLMFVTVNWLITFLVRFFFLYIYT